MKKILLAILLLVSSVSLFSQNSQGDWFVGGAVSYSSSDDTSDYGSAQDVDNKFFRFTPSVGTFISNTVAVGIAVGYSYNKFDIKYEEDYVYDREGKSKQYIISPFVRKYWKIAGGFSFYGEASLPVVFGNNKSTAKASQESGGETYEDNHDFFALGMSLAPGFEYRINNWISVETQLSLFNLSYSKVSPEEGDKSTVFQINADTNNNSVGDLTVGVKFFF